MTFELRYKYLTDVKTISYEARPYELVQVDPSGGTLNITFPPNLTFTDPPDHGATLGIKNVAFNPTPITISAGTNNIEDDIGRVNTTAEMVVENQTIEWVFDATNSIWRILSKNDPFFVPERWMYTGAGILLGTNTQIPLTFQTDFLPISIFFTANAGNLECVRQFSGFIDLVCYIEFLASGNNQDGSFDIELWPVLGTPTIIQGFGLVGSSAVPRAGTYYEQRFTTTFALIDVGEVIGFRGSEGIGSSMDVTVEAQTGIIARNV